MAKLRTKPQQKRGNPNWKKGGKSPNPGGRPKTARIADSSREWLAEVNSGKTNARALVEKLGKAALTDGDWQAARLLIEYAEGKPKQSIDVDLTVEDRKRELSERAIAAAMAEANIEREEAIAQLERLNPEIRTWIN